MLPLLQSIEALTQCRDRERLPSALIQAVATQLGGLTSIGIFARDLSGHPRLRAGAGPEIMASTMAEWPQALSAVCPDRLLVRSLGAHQCAAVVLPTSELRGETLILAIDAKDRDLTGQADALLCLVRIYGNQVRLLDYSELDTLTRLLNRKTFDETFERLLMRPDVVQFEAIPGNRRQSLGVGEPAWLCVIDVDYFKRINDSFGHLFGDEVLLRMGDLMRKTFRDGDRLFRFGGEEFVVILNACDETLAMASFERFRQSVEHHEFPQVGKVTCSLGFTRVSVLDVATDVLGRADEALYYAKHGGRNQVHCYERLVAAGAISPAVTAGAAANDDQSIDALFEAPPKMSQSR